MALDWPFETYMGLNIENADFYVEETQQISVQW